MRKGIFIVFLISFLVSIFYVETLALAILPSLLISYWVWRDGDQINSLNEEIYYLRRKMQDTR